MNFQNIPRNNKRIKRCFVPKYDALVAFDYEQIEYRLLAYYLAVAVGDERMVQDFIAGNDPHAATAALVLGREPNSDNERQIGKTANFSIVYAGGVPTILRQMEKAGIPCDRRQAKIWLRALHDRMPGVKELNAMILEEIQIKGYIFDIFGRRYHPDPDIPWHDAVRKLLNALLQGCAAGLTREALVKIDHGLKDAGMRSHQVNTVHDEILLDVFEDEIEALAELGPQWMGNEQLEEVLPITTEMKLSRVSWADMEEYSAV